MTNVAFQQRLDLLGEATTVTIHQVMDLAQLEVEVDDESGGAAQSVPVGLAFIEWSQRVLSNSIYPRR
jgi:hypothetical protein